MATSENFLCYVLENIPDRRAVRSRKMFGEYTIYLNDKPVLLICDNTVFAKKLPELEDLCADCPESLPYEGTKVHWILDPEDRERFPAVLDILEQITPQPKKRKNRRDKYACMAQRRNFL